MYMRVPGKQSLRIGGDCFAEDCDRRHDISYSRVIVIFVWKGLVMRGVSDSTPAGSGGLPDPGGADGGGKAHRHIDPVVRAQSPLTDGLQPRGEFDRPRTASFGTTDRAARSASEVKMGEIIATLESERAGLRYPGQSVSDMMSDLFSDGFSTDDIADIIKMRPNDAFATLTVLASGDLDFDAFTREQWLTIAKNCGAAALKGVGVYSNELQRWPDEHKERLMAELARRANDDGPLPYRPAKLVVIAHMHGIDALDALRAHAEALEGWGHTPYQISEIVNHHGAAGLQALTDFYNSETGQQTRSVLTPEMMTEIVNSESGLFNLETLASDWEKLRSLHPNAICTRVLEDGLPPPSGWQ
jgi:hypothetical protein